MLLNARRGQTGAAAVEAATSISGFDRRRRRCLILAA